MRVCISFPLWQRRTSHSSGTSVSQGNKAGKILKFEKLGIKYVEIVSMFTKGMKFGDCFCFKLMHGGIPTHAPRRRAVTGKARLEVFPLTQR